MKDNKVYLVQYDIYDSWQIYSISKTREKAKQKIVELYSKIVEIKKKYQELYNSNYDQDLRYVNMSFNDPDRFKLEDQVLLFEAHNEELIYCNIKLVEMQCD